MSKKDGNFDEDVICMRRMCVASNSSQLLFELRHAHKKRKKTTRMRTKTDTTLPLGRMVSSVMIKVSDDMHEKTKHYITLKKLYISSDDQKMKASSTIKEPSLSSREII